MELKNEMELKEALTKIEDQLRILDFEAMKFRAAIARARQMLVELELAEDDSQE